MLRLITLGGTDLRDARGRPVTDVLAQPKRFALLTYLAVEGRRAPVPRDRLLALFWPESDEARARNALSQALHHLRRSLGKSAILEAAGTDAVSTPTDAIWCDATAFAEAIEGGQPELGLDLYRGEFCPHLAASGSPDFDHWLDVERRRLARLAFKAARGLADQDPRFTRRALAIGTEDEEELRTLLLLLERAGDAGGALEAFESYARGLKTDLDAEPEAGTVKVAAAIRERRGASITTDPLPRPSPPAGTGAAPQVPTPAPPPTRRRWLATVPLVVALLGAGAFLWRGRAASPTSVRTLAVLPFAVRGQALSYLRDGMVDLLSAKLDGASGLRAVDPRAVIAAGDSDVHRLGAAWYIRGDVVEIAGRLQLGASLIRAESGRTIATASVTGDTAALFDLVDQLSGQILAGLVQGRDTTITSLAALTTHSLPALKAFLRGEEALREGRDAEAGAAYREAAELDTTFALAEYRLALVGVWVSVPGVEDATLWANRAERNSGRLTPLGRDLLSAYRSYRAFRMDETELRYRQITASYPANVEAWMMLGETGFHFGAVRGRSPLESAPAFRRVLELEPGNSHAMIHLARLAAFDGRKAMLDSLVRQYQEQHPDVERGLEIRALQAFGGNDQRERAAVVSAAGRSQEFTEVGVLEAAAMYTQDLEVARELSGPLPRALVQPNMRTAVGRMMIDLPLAEGRLAEEHTPLLDSATETDWRLASQAIVAGDPIFPMPARRVAEVRARTAGARPLHLPALGFTPVADLSGELQHYWLGLMSLRLGDQAAARAHLEALMAVHDSLRQGPARALAHGLRAELARSRGDLRGALAELQDFPLDYADPGPHSFARWGLRERFLHGELLHALGRDEEAMGWYDSFSGPYDMPYLAPAHLRRAQIYARLGDRERAQFHYRRFLSIWKNCDAEFRVFRDSASVTGVSSPR